MENGAEKRKYLRLPKPYKVEAKEIRLPMPSSLSIDSNCFDISEGGFCVPTSRSFEPGTKLQVKIFIPSLNKHSPGFFKIYENDIDQSLAGIAEVSWCTPKGGRYMTGLRFSDVDTDDTRALASLIRKIYRDLEAKGGA